VRARSLLCPCYKISIWRAAGATAAPEKAKALWGRLKAGTVCLGLASIRQINFVVLGFGRSRNPSNPTGLNFHRIWRNTLLKPLEVSREMAKTVWIVQNLDCTHLLQFVVVYGAPAWFCLSATNMLLVETCQVPQI
jgi:hypothetical protein